MTKPVFCRVPALALILLTGGCVQAVNAPSLASRPTEHLTATEPSPAPEPSPPIAEDASRQERTGALIAQAREGDACFRERIAQAQSLVAGGSNAAVGSEAWVQAQQEISRADVLRDAVTQSLADLDALQIAAAQSGAGAETLAALADAIAAISSMDASERDAIQSLRDQLSAP